MAPRRRNFAAKNKKPKPQTLEDVAKKSTDYGKGMYEAIGKERDGFADYLKARRKK